MINKIKQILKFWFIPNPENEYKPQILKGKSCLVIAVILICLQAALFGFFSYFPKTFYFAVVTAERLTELTNQSRQANNLPVLQTNDKLNEAAYLKAKDILEKDYFAHTSPLGITPWYWFKQANYNYRRAGENLAIDFVDSEPLHSAWINSPSHRANILNSNYKDMGIVVLTGDFNGRQTTVAVQLFGVSFEGSSQKQSASTPPISAAEQPETKGLASVRETEKEPILTPEEKKIEPQILQDTQEKIKEFEKFVINNTETKDKNGPKILSSIAEKSNKIIRQIFIFGLLAMAMLLLLNIFIKIQIQHRGIIVNSLLVIVLLVALILINDKNLLNIGLKII